MATTFIYSVKSTPQASLEYGTQDKIQKVLSKDGSQDSLNYICQNRKGIVYDLPSEYLEKMGGYITHNGDEIILKTISTGINCSIKNAHGEFKMVRETMNKSNGSKGNLQYCIIQAFGTDLDPAIANEIGVMFAKEYLSDYQTVVSTHIDTGLVHNHIEFNATSFVTGKKFNNCLEEINKRREISDRICEEYGLDILEETRTAKFTRWTDDNDRTHYYEPTKRKDEKIAERSEGRTSKADVGSFVNTDTFELSETVKETNAEVIKRDIDILLPEVASFDHLVYLLREMGYRVRDKKKDGDYMAHISYKAPEQGKATREDKLGEEYTRETLTERIEKQRIEKQRQAVKAADTDGQSKGVTHTAAVQDERILVTGTPNERAAADTAISDERIDEAAVMIRERYVSQTFTFNHDVYIIVAATDVSKKYDILLNLRKKPSETREEKRERYIAYCKSCIIDDIALINYIERNGSRDIFDNKEFSRILNRIMTESRENGDLFSDSLKRLVDSLDETGMSRESQIRENRYSHRERKSNRPHSEEVKPSSR